MKVTAYGSLQMSTLAFTLALLAVGCNPMQNGDDVRDPSNPYFTQDSSATGIVVGQFLLYLKPLDPNGAAIRNASSKVTLTVQGNGRVSRGNYYDDDGTLSSGYDYYDCHADYWSKRANPNCDAYIGRKVDSVKTDCFYNESKYVYGDRPLVFWQSTVSQDALGIDSDGSIQSIFDVSSGKSTSQTLDGECTIEDVSYDTIQTVKIDIRIDQPDGSSWQGTTSFSGDDIVKKTAETSLSPEHQVLVDSTTGTASVFATLNLTAVPAP